MSEIPKNLQDDLNKEIEGFKFTYSNLLQSLEGQNHKVLKEILKPKLYEKIVEGYNFLESNHKCLEQVKENEEVLVSFHNEFVAAGVNVGESVDKSLPH